MKYNFTFLVNSNLNLLNGEEANKVDLFLKEEKEFTEYCEVLIYFK